MLWSQVNISESTIPYIDCISSYVTHNSDFVHHGCLTVRALKRKYEGLKLILSCFPLEPN